MPLTSVTTPQQASVLRLLDMRPPEQLQSAATISPAVVALMTGLANAKSETAAKNAADTAASAPTPEITTRTDPKTGQTVHDVKGIVVGDGQANVQQAYDLPQVDLAKQLAPISAQFHHAIPGGPDLQQKLGTFYGRYQLLRELGNGRMKALIDAGLIQARPDRQEAAAAQSLADHVDQQRLAQGIVDFKTAEPLIMEADRQRRLNRQEAGNARLIQNDRERAINEAITKTDWTGMDPEDRAASLAAQVGLDPNALTQAHKARLDRTADKQQQRQHDAKVESWRKDPALGQYPTFETALKAFGEPVDDAERAQMQIDYNRFREETVRTRQNEIFRQRQDQRAAESQARADAAAARSDAAGVRAEKRLAMLSGKTVDAGSLFTGKMTAGSLLALQGNSKYDQDSVHSAIAAGAEHFTETIADRQSRMKSIDEVLAQPPNPDRDGVIPDSQRQLYVRLRGEKQQLMKQNARDSKSLKALVTGAPEAAAPAPVPAATPTPVIKGSKGTVMKVGGKLVYQPH